AIDIANNTVGPVMTMGVLNNVDTSGFGAGNTIYVSPTTAGALTTTKPTHPNITHPVGECEDSSATVGAILVNCTQVLPASYDGVNGTSWAIGDATGTTKSLQMKNASGTGTLQWNPSTNRTITLPDSAGTVYVSGGTDVPITDGGTGVSTLPTGVLKGAGTG